MDKTRILIADSDKLTQKSLYELLWRRDFQADIADSVKDALACLEENTYHVILADISNIESVELLECIKQKAYPSNVIILTSYGNVEVAVNSMKLGAFDYLVKPVEDNKILEAIGRAAASPPIFEDKPVTIKKLTRKEAVFHGIVGSSHSMKAIYSILERISNSKATVFLRGESGTGKRMVAHALHMTDRKRRGKPVVEISCGALPREIIESELFGHARGAFTGAIMDRKGRFEMANGGTVLLDDIDSLTPDLQVKLLRVLQHKEFERVGENKTIKVDVRIVASTNQDLERAVDEKRFREDLYYRLNVISITIPPLRERKEDLAALVDHFINMFSRENHKKIKGVAEDVMPALTAYSWPGNVRELENIIERAVILDTDGIITTEDLPEAIAGGGAFINAAGLGGKVFEVFSSLKNALQEPEKVHIMRVLKEVGGNKKKAADKLGVNRTTLYNKLRKYNISSETEMG